MSAGPAPTKACARCKANKPLSAYDSPERKNCSECAAAEAARRKAPKVPKPDGWKAAKPGETPLKRCIACGESKVWSAFPAAGSDICRECVTAPTEPPSKPADGKALAVTYSPELGERIAELIAARVPMHEIAAMPGMPSDTTIYKWRLQHPEFAAALDIAREHRADARADMVDKHLADLRAGKIDAHSAKVLIEAELRLAGKEHPARYGERVTSDVTVRPGKAEDKPNTGAWIERVLGAGKAVASNVVPLLPAPDRGEEDAA